MYSKTASKRYAKALIESATEGNKLEETYSEINSVKNLLINSRELSDYLSNPTISKEDKGNLIIKIILILFTISDFVIALSPTVRKIASLITAYTFVVNNNVIKIKKIIFFILITV